MLEARRSRVATSLLLFSFGGPLFTFFTCNFRSAENAAAYLSSTTKALGVGSIRCFPACLQSANLRIRGLSTPVPSHAKVWGHLWDVSLTHSTL
jgi:hypothetical protein